MMSPINRQQADLRRFWRRILKDLREGNTISEARQDLAQERARIWDT